jgi:S-methylmethionine-dependent homocysteine/selenocysteine methylase
MALTGISALYHKHASGRLLILDGATGTEIERRGFPMHDIAWSGGVMFERPELVREIHADYIRAGADVVTANSYSCCRHVLEPADFGDRVEAANRLAIRLAREARDEAADRPVVIAGCNFGVGHRFLCNLSKVGLNSVMSTTFGGVS